MSGPVGTGCLGEVDLHLLHEGRHLRLHDHLGVHLRDEGAPGARFALWAPNARAVEVVGDVNGWEPGDALERGPSGVWEGFLAGVSHGQRYRYRVTAGDGEVLYKSDPFAFCGEAPPGTASVVWDLGYEWGDAAWMASRGEGQRLTDPISIYEVHLGSWRRHPDGWSLSYADLAEPLAEHATRCGFTHVELLPVMEHPYYGSWGYQSTGYFAPTRRFGDPQGLMTLVDRLHQAGVGVILDWVPSHFAADEHGLFRFDGTHLYEHADPRLGWHPDWGTAVFDLSRPEVRAFLLSSAQFWLERYHADGLRVDAVASMLYRDYSRADGAWLPNEHGGREDLHAISFLRELNETVYAEHPDVQTYAEESTAWPLVSRPTWAGGLGFGFKWDMGWMHDTLAYMGEDPVHRKYHHHQLTFRGLYAFNESFVLPLSHDEVVHLKGSLLAKMPGDEWQQLANLRLLLALQWTTPGKKLLFMGAELAQGGEWAHDGQLDWWRLEQPAGRGMATLVEDLNRLYRTRPSLHVGDCRPDGFRWLLADDTERSVYAWVRSDPEHGDEPVVVVVNATPVVWENVRLGVPGGEGHWEVLLDTDDGRYGGSGALTHDLLPTHPAPTQGEWWSIVTRLPPLGVLVLGRHREDRPTGS